MHDDDDVFIHRLRICFCNVLYFGKKLWIVIVWMSEHSNISSLSSSWQPDVNNDDDDERGLEIEKRPFDEVWARTN